MNSNRGKHFDSASIEASAVSAAVGARVCVLGVCVGVTWPTRLVSRVCAILAGPRSARGSSHVSL